MPYVEPRVLIAGLSRPFKHSWPKRPAPWAETFKMMQKWDQVNRFASGDASGTDPMQVMQLAVVPKSADEDRQILDAQGPNGREDRLVDGHARHLPGASQLCEMYIAPSQQLIAAAMDRKRYYHQWSCSRSRKSGFQFLRKRLQTSKARNG